MKIFPTTSIKQLDADTIENEPIASIDLMERASRDVYKRQVDGQPFYVQHAAAYTLERFLGTSYAQLKVASLHLVGIKSADRVADVYKRQTTYS